MRADRLLSIMLLLRRRGRLTTEKLAQELEVSRRTIMRDIDAISAAGIPILCEGGHGGGVWLSDKYRISLTGLKEDELRSLFVGRLPGPLSDLGLEKAEENSLLKLSATLPSPQQVQVARDFQRILLDPSGWWPNSKPSPFLTELQNAIYQDQLIETSYERADGTLVERVLEPYSLVAKANVWYLVAQREGDFKTYRVSRFHKVVLLPMFFSRSKKFDLTDYWKKQGRVFTVNLAQSQYLFTLRLAPQGLQFLRRHVSDAYPYEVLEQEDTHKDGWLTVQIELGSIDAAKMLVMGLGTRAKVIEPQGLHEAVLQAAIEILHFHDGRAAKLDKPL